MDSERLLEDIQEINTSYLLLVQRLIYNDRELAMFRLKINESVAEFLSKMSINDIFRLSRCNQLLCHFSLNNENELGSLLNVDKNEYLMQAQAAIMLSGKNLSRQPKAHVSEPE